MGYYRCHTQFEPQLKEFGLEKASKYTVLLVDNRGITLCFYSPLRKSFRYWFL